MRFGRRRPLADLRRVFPDPFRKLGLAAVLLDELLDIRAAVFLSRFHISIVLLAALMFNEHRAIA